MAERVWIGLVYPELLGTYGDRGNAEVLLWRAAGHGLDADLVEVPAGQPVPAWLDVYVLGGGEDAAQAVAAGLLRSAAGDGLRRAADQGRVVLAVCGAFQLLGRVYLDGRGREVRGLGLLEVETAAGSPRLVGEVVTRTREGELLTGFENHGGRSWLGPGVEPLGRVLRGGGNNGSDATDGGRQGAMFGTYLHGPVLARNPALADLLLGQALARRGRQLGPLPPAGQDRAADLHQARLRAVLPRRDRHRRGARHGRRLIGLTSARRYNPWAMVLATTARQARRAAILGAVGLAAAGCGVHAGRQVRDPPAASAGTQPPGAAVTTAGRPPAGAPASTDVYAADRPGMLSPVVRRFPSRVYVPDSGDGTVDVVDPATRRVVDHFATGRLPQHVVPSWDLRRLWVTNDESNSLTPIDPATGRPGRPVPVADPYNLYFTPDGSRAIVVAERLRRLDFRDPHTMRLRHALAVPCAGVDHLDFTADGRFLLASCEFSGQLLWVDVRRERVAGVVRLEPGSKPQDVKLAPDGRLFYVADMRLGGVHLVAAARPRLVGFLATGSGAHGLYVSRDSRSLYVSNRGGGSVSVVSFATRRVVATWRLPGGGSPDMGGVSADGRVLWLAGRYDAEVYAIDTRSGALLARVRVGQGPHGLCVYPQPGRYSLGHTGVFR